MSCIRLDSHGYLYRVYFNLDDAMPAQSQPIEGANGVLIIESLYTHISYIM